MAGGMNPVSSSTVDLSIKLDLKEQGKRAWTPTTGVLNVKRAFHQVVKGFNPGEALAIGGMNDTDTCTDTIEQYNPVHDNWTISNLKLSTPRQKFCALNDEINKKIYIVGGSKCNSSEFNATEYVNATYNVFPTVPILDSEVIDYSGVPSITVTAGLNSGREFPYCGLVSEAISRDPKYLLVAGGILDNGYVTNTSERFTLDGSTTLSFTDHTEMQCHPIYPAASSSMLVLDETSDDRDIYLIELYWERSLELLLLFVFMK